MVRKALQSNSSNWTILLTDDDEIYAESVHNLLKREGHRVLLATSGEQALELLAREHVDLLLLDYFMHGITGEEVVSALRISHPLLQVILQTGYASEQPPRALLKRLDIQGYHDKSDGPEKLLMWVDVGLKAAYSTHLVHKSRQSLRYILDVTPDLHKLQPLEALLQGIIYQVTGLLGVANSFLASCNRTGREESLSGRPEGFLAMRDDDTELVVHAATGRFAGIGNLVAEHENEELRTAIATAIDRPVPYVTASSTLVPLNVGNAPVGVIYLDRAIGRAEDLEMLTVFANQAAVAVRNAQLFEMATVDRLTGTYVRRFIEQLISSELARSFRQREPLALMIIDMDGLKRINDVAGHLHGDQALVTMGSILRTALRESDVAGRLGGDEFIVALPNTHRDGAERVARRILDLLRAASITTPHETFPVRGSIGMVVLDPPAGVPAQVLGKAYFQGLLTKLVETADSCMYTAKRSQTDKLNIALNLAWPAP